MATYQFSALADGQAISFNPSADLLNFDQTVIAAADIRAVAEGSNLRITVVSGANTGKDILLTNVSALQLALSNITFADGSRLIFGDNTTGTTADNSANNLAGTAGRDQINGFGGNDTLGGGGGNDLLIGGAGNDSIGGGSDGADTLEGGLGNDILAGGSGQDTFVFREVGAANADTLNDFGTNWDRIELDGSALTALGAEGQFASGDARFYAAAGATGGHDADDRIIFNTSTGQIFYDADGAGAGAAQILANLPGGRAVAAADFRVVGSPTTSGGGSGNDSLIGTSGNDTLDGFGGNDTLDGGAGSDLLRGGDGNDTLRDLDSSEFADTLEGGLGNDTYDLRSPTSDGQNTTIVDAGGVDILLTNHDGFLSLHPDIENLTLFGGDFAGGNDLNNTITTVSGASQRYFADGGGGNDTLIGGVGSELYRFTPGESGSYGNDSVDGGDGFDTLLFDERPEVIVADMRSGTLTSGISGSVTFTHVERLAGGTQGDRLTAHDGATWLDANGVQHFSGAWLYGSGGNDTLIGGAADDYISGDGGDEVNNYFSDSGDGDDSISGGGGNDWITFRFSFGVSLSYGNDVVDGGQGIDTVAFGDPLFSGLVVDLGAGTASGGGVDGAGSAMLSNVENVVISSGGVMDNRLTGSSVANLLQGGRGNDTIDGGAGNDTLTGGEGRDQFVFAVAPTSGNADRITDFQTGLDKVFLEPGAFSAIGAPGNFAAGDARFTSNASGTAQDANDRVVYNTNTGQLWYDADGSGAGAAQLIATLTGAPSVAATDIAAGEGGGSGGIVGTEGNDTLNGTAGDELIDGRGGNDIIDGFGGNDTLDGGFGNDWVSGTGLVLGGDGDDRLEQYFASGNATLRGGAGNDELTGYDELYGDAGDDVLFAPHSNGGVLMDGGAGNDTMSYAFGDSIDGGAGSDTIVIGEQVDLVIDLRTQTITSNGGAALGTFLGIESIDRGQQEIFGGDDHTYRFDDYFIGNDASNVLQSNLGSDTLNGGAGNDTLIAYNLDGNDVYTFSSAPGSANADLVVGFISGHATLQLDLPAHAALGARGNFVAGDARFFAGAGANSGQDASDRVIYNTSTGQLWYDADGSGAGAAQLIATLTNANQTGAALLTVTDIAVIDSRSAPAGTAGDDWMAGVDGYVGDSFSGGAGNDRFDGREGADTISGGIGNDTMDGGDGADLVTGGDGNDTLRKAAGRHDGGADLGMDTLDGGLGDDTYELNQVLYDIQDVEIEFPFNVVIVDAGGVDTVVSTGSWTLDEGLENLRLREWAAGSRGEGNSSSNLIVSEFHDPDSFGGDTLDGAGGNDTLLGGTGNDSINGGAGNDSIVGGDGNDTMSGDAGNDTFLFAVALTGFNSDHIAGFATGADKIQFDGEVFTNIGPAGNFAAGDARFFAGAGANSGQDASDRIVYNTSTGQLWYDADGNGAGAAKLIATLSGAPALSATDIAAIGSPAGPMTLNGTAGNDSLVGASANDTINGLAGDDTLVGNAGNDSLNGGSGIDSMDGGLGDDTYVVSSGDVLIDAGGKDTVVTDVTWSLGVEFENLTMTGSANITMQGNTLNNLIIGNAGNNTFNARAGDDTILAGAGDDRIDMFGNGAPSYGNEVVDGGTGFDTMDFSGYAKTGIVVNLASGTVAGGGDGGSGTVAVSNVERVVTGAFNDRLTGNAAANAFDGRGGQDTISGGGGNDTLTGGAGNDFFVFSSSPNATNVDRITDFVSGFDRLQLELETFQAIGATGNFASGDGRFWAAAGATAGHDANDRVVYNSSTGSLYYDADGSGAGAAVLVATFQGNPAIAAMDITVI